MNNLDSTYFFPQVLQVVPNEEFGLYVYFNDGSVRFYDMKPLLNPGTVFEKFRDISIFRSKLTILNGTVAWDINGNRDSRDCIDIDPLVIFESPMVDDPLK